MIDFVRGAAVLLMICYHAVLDLHYFAFFSFSFLRHPCWRGLAFFIVFLFLLCVGMSLALAHKGGIRWDAVRKRTFRLGGWALAVTALTYAFFPGNFVFFGVLHCITLASLAGVLFVGRPGAALVLGLLLLVSDLALRPTLLPLSRWLGVAPMDYVPFYPWVGVVLLGIFLESVGFHRIRPPMASLSRLLRLLGRHSLAIYLLHQPLIMGGLFLLYRLRRPL